MSKGHLGCTSHWRNNMARRKGFLHAVAQAQRDAERRQRADLQAQSQRAKELERARKAYQKAQEAAQKAQAQQIAQAQKEQARLYLESRNAEVDLLNEQ